MLVSVQLICLLIMNHAFLIHSIPDILWDASYSEPSFLGTKHCVYLQRYQAVVYSAVKVTVIVWNRAWSNSNYSPFLKQARSSVYLTQCLIDN